MGSQILGRLDLDYAHLNADLLTLERNERPKDLYDEFTAGDWVNLPLFNRSGRDADAMFQDSDVVCATPLLRRLPYLAALIEEHFVTERLIMARVRDVRDWSIVPHRDFLELDNAAGRYFRVLMTLEDNPAFLNSDESMVFRMRPGEVWFLDAAQAHSAINHSSSSRWSLCLDFDLGDDYEHTNIFRDVEQIAPAGAPLQVFRRPLPSTPGQMIDAIASVVSPLNLQDLAFGLGKLHFTTDIAVDTSWDWLVAGCRRSRQEQLTLHAERAREYFLGSRKLGERFSFIAA